MFPISDEYKQACASNVITIAGLLYPCLGVFSHVSAGMKRIPAIARYLNV